VTVVFVIFELVFIGRLVIPCDGFLVATVVVVCRVHGSLYHSCDNKDSAVGPYFVLRQAQRSYDRSVEPMLMYLCRILHRLSTYATDSKSADFESESPDFEKKSPDFELGRWGVTDPRKVRRKRKSLSKFRLVWAHPGSVTA
jgi:hypothetical protein